MSSSSSLRRTRDLVLAPGLLLMGPPGAGKSTVVQGLMSRHGSQIAHFGVRAFFLQQLRLGTDIGLAAQSFVERCMWMPDEFVCSALEAELPLLLGRFCVIEGFPATEPQAKWLLGFQKRLGLQRFIFVYIDVPDHICFTRSRNRLRCPSCMDDKHLAVSVTSAVCGTCGSKLDTRPDDDERFFLERLARHRNLHRQIRRSYGQPDVLIDGTSQPSAVLSLVENLIPLDPVALVQAI